MSVIVAGIERDGYVVVDHALPLALSQDLLGQLMQLDPDGFKLAGIGRDLEFQRDVNIRNDRILWLDDQSKISQQYFAWTEQLRLSLNGHFFLGLFEYECMYAHYPQDAFYLKHLDSFHSGTNRKISTILYLNHDWQKTDGGELLLYRPDDPNPFEVISPEFGKLVVFLSEDFPHEVLPAKRSRYSLTGWFKVNQGI